MQLNKFISTATISFFLFSAFVLPANVADSRADGNLFSVYLDQLPKPPKVVEREEVDPMFSEAGDEPDSPVTGVRALSSQNISNVKPDAEAVKALEKYAIDKSQASNFASELGLKTRKIDYLVKDEQEKSTAPAQDKNND